MLKTLQDFVFFFFLKAGGLGIIQFTQLSSMTGGALHFLTFFLHMMLRH